MSQRCRTFSLWAFAWSPVLTFLIAASALVAQPAPPPTPQAQTPQARAAVPQDLTTAVDSSFTRALPWRFLGPVGEEDADLDHLALGGGERQLLFAARADGPPLRLELEARDPFADGRAEDFASVPRATALVPDPRRPGLLYASAEGGALLRYDGAAEQLRLISVWPRPPGFGAGPVPLYRFAPVFPIFFSAHDPDALYAAGNLLFTSTDSGQSWAAVSPDLTRSRAPRAGRPEAPASGRGVLVAAFESHLEAGVFWTASDTGLVHRSRDFAATWVEVTPPQLPAGARITDLVPHPRAPGYVYLSAVGESAGETGTEPRGWIFRSQDYGATWTELTRGLPPATTVRALAPDPERSGLLFAATDAGLYLSLDDGGRWRRWPVAEPAPAIRDLLFAGSSLIAAVKDQGLWLLDDLSPLRQLTPDILSQDFYLFSPRQTLRHGAEDPLRAAGGGAGEGDRVSIFYRLGALPAGTEVRLQLLGADGTRIRSLSTAVGVVGNARRPPARPGLNRFDWDLRYPPAEGSGEIGQQGGGSPWPGGPQVLPGAYLVRLAVGSDSKTAQFRVDRDPRVTASPEALQAQFDFLLAARDELGRIHRLRQDIDRLGRLLAEAAMDGAAEPGAPSATPFRNLRQGLEGLDLLLGPAALVGPEEERSGGLAEQISILAAAVELALDRPTGPQQAVFGELVAEVEAAATTLERLRGEELATLNRLRLEQGLQELRLQDLQLPKQSLPEQSLPEQSLPERPLPTQGPPEPEPAGPPLPEAAEAVAQEGDEISTEPTEGDRLEAEADGSEADPEPASTPEPAPAPDLEAGPPAETPPTTTDDPPQMEDRP